MNALDRNGSARETEVVAKPARRRFTLEYKRRIVREADGCKTGCRPDGQDDAHPRVPSRRPPHPLPLRDPHAARGKPDGVCRGPGSEVGGAHRRTADPGRPAPPQVVASLSVLKSRKLCDDVELMKRQEALSVRKELEPGKLAAFVALNELKVRGDYLIWRKETFPQVVELGGELRAVSHK